jgi:hypothetical protein
MSLREKDARKLSAELGDRCCLCGSLRNVQLQYIVPPQHGGASGVENLMTLCDECDQEVHSRRPARYYSPRELKQYRRRTSEQVRRETRWLPGNKVWQEDKDLILYFAQCLDRAAFRVRFDVETSFREFDKAMEETLLALDTGYWRLGDGRLIERAKGRAYVAHKSWREKVDRIAQLVDLIRTRLHQSFGLDRTMMQYRSVREYEIEIERLLAQNFRQDRSLIGWIDQQRQEAIGVINSLLQEIGHEPLRAIVVQDEAATEI